MTSRRRPPPLPGPALTKALLRWFAATRRPLPWRRTKDPYRIWVAEVLLQQTQVSQAIPYYRRFLRRFPNIRALAQARETTVLRTWQGAGYYARARHLRAAARKIVQAHGGKLPTAAEALEELPGFGPYIARAVASLAYGAPVVALEANGLRVASRWWADRGDVTKGATRRRLERRLGLLLDAQPPGAFNEAVMELGETVCVPQRPRCPACPVRSHCRAFAILRDPGDLPRRPPRRRRPHVRAAVVAVALGPRFLVQQRPPTGLLGGLYEFPGGKIEAGETPRQAAQRELREETGIRAGGLALKGVVRHAYSHFTVELHVFRGALPRGQLVRLTPSQRWVAPSKLRTLPLPKATEKVLDLLFPPQPRRRLRAQISASNRPRITI